MTFERTPPNLKDILGQYDNTVRALIAVQAIKLLRENGVVLADHLAHVEDDIASAALEHAAKGNAADLDSAIRQLDVLTEAA